MNPARQALLDGAILAVDNAERLLKSAVAISDIDEGVAGSIIVSAWEEMGKALRLAERASRDFMNEAVVIDSRLFNTPEVIEMLVQDLDEFGKFARTPLRDHNSKLLAFRERFRRHRVVEVDDDTVTLAKVDPFLGMSAGDIVLMSRRSTLVDYFPEDGSFKSPLPMFRNPKEVAQFHLESEIPEVREVVEDTQRHLETTGPEYEKRRQFLEQQGVGTE